jgi:glutamate-1-semialdehyde aminotransferase
MIPVGIAAFFIKAKWWIYGGIAVALILGTIWILDRQYDRGYVAGKALGDAAIAAASTKALEQKADDERAYRALSEKFARLDFELAKRETVQQVETIERVRTVKGIVSAYPNFGAVTRPAALSVVRDADLARLRAASDATHVPGNGAPRLPAADSRER